MSLSSKSTPPTTQTMAVDSALDPHTSLAEFLPRADRFFYPEIYIENMLSEDKVFSCEGMQNSTTIQDRPGATIISPILLSMAGVAGHITALFYLHRSKKPNYSRGVFYVLLATLIWTDLIGKLVTTPPAIISYVNGHWVGGTKLCNLHGFTMMTIDLVTHLLVCAMALDRFLCVRHGYFYKTSVTKSRIRLVLMSIWLFGILFCALPLFGMGEYEPQYPGTWCFVNIHVGPGTLWYHRLYTNAFGCINIFCVLTILACNMIVVGTLIATRLSRSRKFSASMHQLPKTITSQRELEIQMSILLLVITLVCLVSWSPIDFLIFLNQIWPHTCREEHIPDLIAVRLASFNQIVDPWAYIICRKVFTSSIWRSCRSFILGRNFSSKRRGNSLNLPFPRNAESGEIGNKINGVTCGNNRKFSLPTPEKRKIGSFSTAEEGHEEKEDKKGAYSYLNFFKKTNSDSPRCRDYLEREKLVFEKETGHFSPKLLFQHGGRNLRFGFQERSPSTEKTLMVSTITQSYFTHSAQEESERRKSLNPEDILTGRRHSWSCSPSVYKQYRTISTQTFRDI